MRFASPIHGLVLCLMAASPVWAQIRPSSPVFVLDLYHKDNPLVVVSARSFDDALRDPAPGAADDSTLDRVVTACSGPPPRLALDIETAGSSANDHPVAKLHRCMQCLKAFEEKRFLTRRNDEVVLIVLFNGAVVKAEDIRPLFEETPRRSELFATAKALLELTRAELAPRLSCAAFTYTLQYQRSRMRVTVPLPPGAVPGTVAAAAAAPANPLKQPAPNAVVPSPTASAETPAARSPEVVLGPAEKWFMSADFSIDQASAGIGKEPVADAEQLKAKAFFVALNFAFGDLLADRDAPLQRRSFLKELLIKVQATPSTEPWEAWAVGLGLRGYRLKTILWNLDVAHPYVTIGRQEVDGAEPRWRVAFGIGFDPRSINRQE